MLDLLSAENEYYQAQRSLINIQADLSIAKLNLLAATGQLVDLFGVEDRLKADEPTKRQVMFYKAQANDDGVDKEGCPASLINMKDFELPKIGFDEALKNVDAQGIDIPLKPIELAQLGSDSGKQAAFVDPAAVSKSLIEQTNAWAKAWESRDINRYIGFYAPTFKPEEGSYETWQATRRERLRAAKNINVEISDIQVIPSFDDPNEYDITFIQLYEATNYKERSRKVLTWKANGKNWQIIREKNLPNNTVYSPKRNNVAMRTE